MFTFVKQGLTLKFVCNTYGYAFFGGRGWETKQLLTDSVQIRHVSMWKTFVVVCNDRLHHAKEERCFNLKQSSSFSIHSNIFGIFFFFFFYIIMGRFRSKM